MSTPERIAKYVTVVAMDTLNFDYACLFHKFVVNLLK